MDIASQEGTFIVQVYVPFAPVDFQPLLLRLNSRSVAADAIYAALAKLLERSPETALPTADGSEYSLFIADAHGNPIAASPISRTAVLRDVKELELPYVLCLDYKSASEDPVTSSAANQILSGGPLTEGERSVIAAHRRDIEAVRAENVKEIERRRLENELSTYKHSVMYEAERRARERAKKMKDTEKKVPTEESEITLAEKSAEEREQAVRQCETELLRTEVDECGRREQAYNHELDERIEIERHARAARIKMEQDARKHWLEETRAQRCRDSLRNIIEDLNKTVEAQRTEQERIMSRNQAERTRLAQVEQGHRDILILEKKKDCGNIVQREEGYKKTLRWEEEKNTIAAALERDRLAAQEADERLQQEWKRMRQYKTNLMQDELEAELIAQYHAMKTA